MTTKEALDIFRGLLARVVPTEENTATTNEAWEAVAVLRAVVEDYERARPLLEAVERAVVDKFWQSECPSYPFKDGYTFDDADEILLAALAYREGRKP